MMTEQNNSANRKLNIRNRDSEILLSVRVGSEKVCSEKVGSEKACSEKVSTENHCKDELHISVRNIVEFIFREGDIDNRSGRLQSPDAMTEGTRIHKKIQSQQDDNYQAEVPLKLELEEELYYMTIEGRADGIFTESFDIIQLSFDTIHPLKDGEELIYDPDSEHEIVWIDEIKGIYRKLDHLEEPFYVHLAQAKCYAFITALQNNLSVIGVQMTYCNLDTEDIKRFRHLYSYEELEEWFTDLWVEYRKWADFECTWKALSRSSIRELNFPFDYRQGQKKLVGDVYRSILRKKTLFMQAPTGVGKTITTIYPSVRAVGEGLADRIFYLTAKTITATVARETFSLLQDHGYKAKVVSLTAKEKMCLCGEAEDDLSVKAECNPLNCPYARGHYDRINDALYSILTNCDSFTREIIRDHAKKYMVCPFELSLDISSFSDDIICDYNYVFDPKVSLKRFFAEGIKGNYIFLVDEAHNMVDRSREMYSASLYKEDFLAAKKLTENRKIKRYLDKCNKILLEYKRECESYQIHDDIGGFLHPLQSLASELDELLQKPEDVPNRKELLEFYFEVRSFLNMYDLVTDKYVIFSEIEEDGRFMLKLFCVDPSENLQRCIDKARSSVFFSATLLPVNYYKSLLSTKGDNYAIYAQSSFTPDQSMILVGRDVSTKYTRRNDTEFRRIACYIYETVTSRKGNYMVFFPSYKLMEQVYDVFSELLECKHESCADVNRTEMNKAEVNSSARNSPEGNTVKRNKEVHCILQTSNMNEARREEFLEEFDHQENYSLVAFCIMGGIFGEGIDLKEEKLIGAIVVGTGLPQICNEREILRNYYEEHKKNGFDYAYRYPGMNKVLQAAGRVIRTETDKGVIVLLDERFLSPDYLSMFPREWENVRFVSQEQIGALSEEFWDEIT